MLTKLKRFYENLKIKDKLFLIIFFIMCMVFLISLLSLQIASNTFMNLLYHETARALNISTASIENELKKIEDISYRIISDADVQQLVADIKKEMTKRDKYLYVNNLMDKLLNLVTARSEEYILSIDFIDTEGESFSNGIWPVRIGEEAKRAIVQKAMEANGKAVFVRSDSDNYSLVLARQIRAIPNLNLGHMGVIIIHIDTEKLVNVYASPSSENVDVVILSSEEIIFLPERFDQIDVTRLVFNHSNGYSIKTIKNRKYFIAHMVSDYSRWIYVNIIPYDSIFQIITLVKFIMIFIFSMLFILTVFISMKLAKNIIKPIERLTMRMKKVEEGEFALEDNELDAGNRMDEIGQLQRDFEIMIKKINVLIKENYTKQLLVKDAQYKALQAQINPHFLYNTLESINWLAKMSKQRNISIMVEALGSLLRSSISQKQHIITMDEELKILKNYIAIQRIRYKERLDIRININDDIRRLKIPKLTLQPIVENSINYGLERMLEPCRITVDFSMTQENVEIIVEDNGPGMEAELLEQLRKGEFKPKGLGIGLKNIDDRIKSIFGANYGLFIESKKNQGTKVYIRIPDERGVKNV